MKQHAKPATDGRYWIFAAALIVIAAVVSLRPDHRPASQPLANGAHRQVRSGGDDDDPPRIDDARDFRILLTIIAGVALGAAVVALQPLLAHSLPVYWQGVGWLLWAAGFFAIVLTYLSTLFGSKLLKNEIDLPHTTSVVAVFLAEGAMFSALVASKETEMVKVWLLTFAAFGGCAVVAIYLVIRKLRAWWLPGPGEAFKSYRMYQWLDLGFASITAIWPSVMVIVGVEYSRLGVVIVSIAALVNMIAACLVQYFERLSLVRQLARNHHQHAL